MIGFITLAMVCVTLLYYWHIGRTNYHSIDSLDEFLIYGRTLGARKFSESYVATGVSVASVVVFFFGYSAVYGMSLLWALVSYLLSLAFLLWLLVRLSKHPAGSRFLTSGHSIIDWLAIRYQSTAIKWTAVAVSVLSLTGILVIEIYIGTVLLSVFEPFRSPNGQMLAIIIFTSLIFAYVYMGGFKSVVDTDHIQVALVFSALVLIAATAWWIWFTHRPAATLNLNLLIPDPFRIHRDNGGWLAGVSFVLSFFVVNFAMQVAYLGNWQRIIAVGDVRILRRGFRGAAVGTALLWVIIIVAGLGASGLVDSVLVVGAEGGRIDVISESVENSASAASGELKIAPDALLSNFLMYLLEEAPLWMMLCVPVIVTGLIAALISTADSHMIPLIQTYVYDVRLPTGKGGAEVSREEEQKFLKEARGVILVILMLALFMFGFIIYGRAMTFVQILFLFFSQQLSLFWPIVLSMYNRRPPATAVLVAILVGVGLTWSMSLYDGPWSQLVYLNAPLAVVASGALILIPATWMFGVVHDVGEYPVASGGDE